MNMKKEQQFTNLEKYQNLSDFLRNADDEREGLAEVADIEQLVKQDLQKEFEKWNY